MVARKRRNTIWCQGFRTFFLYATGLAIICSCVAGPATVAPFSVSGVLLNDTDSRPIEGAFVILEGEPAAQFEASGVKTGSDGRFVIPNVSSAQYQVVAEKRGFLRLTRGFRHEDGGQPAAGKGFTPTDQIELRMVQQAAIAGRVTDSAHQPLAGAVVQLSHMYLQGRRTLLSPVAQVATNDLGEYRIFNVSPGRYYVGAFYQDQGSRLGLRVRPVTESGAGADVITEEYAVTYYPQSLEPEGATPVRARAGQTLADIDIQIAMARSFTIAGVITGLPPNTPTPRVFLQPFQPGGLGALRVSIPAGGATEFRFKSVAPGTYVVRTDVNVGGQVLSAREQVSVGSGPIDSAVLDLRPPFAISGTVSADEGCSLPEDLQLRLNGLDRRFLGPIKPRADGKFEVQVVGPDGYAVDGINQSGTAYVKSAALDYQPIGVNGISIRDPNHALLIVVSDKAGRIEGKVVNSEQHPAASGVVILVASDPQDPRSYAAALSSEGKFELKSLPPGKYRISCFSDLAAPADATWDVQKKVRSSGKEISIAELDKQQVTLEATLADPF